MRILTGHDYYDTALAWGRDEQIVFVRHKDKTILHTATPFTSGLGFRGRLISTHPNVTMEASRYFSVDGFITRTSNYQLSPVIVYFCGKRYAGVKVEIRTDLKDTVQYYWTYDSFVNFLHSKCVDIKSYYNPSYSIYSYFNDTKLSKKEFDFLLENKYTILVSRWNLNHSTNDDEKIWSVDAPDLKKIQFYKVIDAYSAFQEISMWVGGVLTGQGRPMVQISDKYKILKHGFNEWSFRKPPQGK